MFQQPIFQIDAFASTLFTGNPAAVYPLESWLDEVNQGDVIILPAGVAHKSLNNSSNFRCEVECDRNYGKIEECSQARSED